MKEPLPPPSPSYVLILPFLCLIKVQSNLRSFDRPTDLLAIQCRPIRLSGIQVGRRQLFVKYDLTPI